MDGLLASRSELVAAWSFRQPVTSPDGGDTDDRAEDPPHACRGSGIRRSAARRVPSGRARHPRRSGQCRRHDRVPRSGAQRRQRRLDNPPGVQRPRRDEGPPDQRHQHRERLSRTHLQLGHHFAGPQALHAMGVRTAMSRGNDDALGPCIDQRAATANALQPDAGSRSTATAVRPPVADSTSCTPTRR